MKGWFAAFVCILAGLNPSLVEALDLNALEREVEDLRKRLPIKADASTEVTGVLLDRESLSLIFIERVDLRVNAEQLLKMMKEIKVPHICEEYKPLILEGLSLVYVMRAQDGRDIGVMRAGPTECGL